MKGPLAVVFGIRWTYPAVEVVVTVAVASAVGGWVTMVSEEMLTFVLPPVTRVRTLKTVGVVDAGSGAANQTDQGDVRIAQAFAQHALPHHARGAE